MSRLGQEFGDWQRNLDDGDSSSQQEDDEEKAKRLRRMELTRRILVSTIVIIVIIVSCALGFSLPLKFAHDSNASLPVTPIDIYNQVGWTGTMIGASLPLLALIYMCSKKCWRFCFKSCFKKTVTSLFKCAQCFLQCCHCGQLDGQPIVISNIDSTDIQDSPDVSATIEGNRS